MHQNPMDVAPAGIGSDPASPLIHKLFNELLLAVFSYVRVYELADNKWYKLLWVCRLWADIARGSTVFWRSLSITGQRHRTWNKYVLSVGLALSGSIPIYIAISETSTEQNAEICDLLLPHVSRIRGLDISEMEKTKDLALRILLDQKMPVLQDLGVHFKTRMRPCGPHHTPSRRDIGAFLWNLDRAQFPVLSRLFIGDDVSLSGSFPVFSNLRGLALSNCFTGDLSTIAEFVHFLTAHPHLEELYISRYRPTIPDDAKRLRLPATLRKFIINDNAYYTAPFLSLFRFPVHVDVNIVRALDYGHFGDVRDMDRDDEHAINVQHALPTNRNEVLPILSLVDSIEAEHREMESYSLTGRTPSGHSISLTGFVPEYPIYCTRTYHCFSDLVDTFRDAPVVRLKLRGSYSSKVGKAHWQDALRTFPLLEEIRVAETNSLNEYDPRISLIEALQPRTREHWEARDTLGESDEHAILARHLNTLAFTSAAEHNEDEALADTLAACLRSRKEAGVPIEHVHLTLGHLTRPKGVAHEVEESDARRVEVYTEALYSLVSDLQLDVVSKFQYMCGGCVRT
ncbi:hypothetical protein C8Q78DRAFT_277201 [Trametes maxima]|nr:hypothetical protein C8Q78DRAFT_277201 [Trametes maxima]